MVKWMIELSEFDLTFEKRGELTKKAEQPSKGWTLLVNGASNRKGSGAEVVLEGLDGVLIEQLLRFEYKAGNNQAEYEVLLVEMRLAKEIGAQVLTTKSDSLLVANQVNNEYQVRELQLIKYWDMVKKLEASFESFTFLHVPKDQNEHMNLLSKFASTQKGGLNRTVIQEMISRSNIKPTNNALWKDLIATFLRKEEVPDDPLAAKKLKKEVAKYTLISQQLYRRGFFYPFLKCLDLDKVEYATKEIHEGGVGPTLTLTLKYN
ncbi:hypothetical protein CR513_42908, partial [Mucuna pruriens]